MKINEIDYGEKNIIKTDEYAPEIRQYCELIKRDCSIAVKAVSEARGFLYRGVNDGTAPNAFHGKSREDRMAMNVASFIGNAFDEKLENHGFRALRGNSIYCTGKAADAANYGAIYIIFPINGFSMTWSPRIDDLFFKLKKLFNGPDELHKRITIDTIENKFTDEFFQKLGYQNNDLAAAICSHNEILINGEYYAFRVDANIISAFKQEFWPGYSEH